MRPASIAEKDFIYQKPSREYMVCHKRLFESFLEETKAKIAGMSLYDISINDLLLYKVIIRVDKRADYFEYFHSEPSDIMHMSEDKEIALYAYWIIKYKPFYISNPQQNESFVKEYRCTVNELLAAFLIVSYECYLYPELKDFFTPSRIDVLIYDLLNRNISKSAMIMYVESFAGKR